MPVIRKGFVVIPVLLTTIAVPYDNLSILDSSPGHLENTHQAPGFGSEILTQSEEPPMPEADWAKRSPPRNAIDAAIPDPYYNIDPADQLVSVFGRVESESGEILAWESITVYSPRMQTHYSTISNQFGEYMINYVLAGNDYVINVSSKKLLKRYTKESVNLSESQNSHNIILEYIPLGMLTGTVLDAYELPVKNLTLKARTLEKAYWSTDVITDATGAFVIPDFPEGRFEISAAGPTPFRAAGLVFDPQSGEPIYLSIDYGTHNLSGRIFDESGQAFDGAYVVVMWTGRNNGVSIKSTHQVTTGAAGKFRFTGLGPGNHELIVSAWNDNEFKKTVKQTINLGVDSGELEILIDTL